MIQMSRRCNREVGAYPGERFPGIALVRHSDPRAAAWSPMHSRHLKEAQMKALASAARRGV